MLPRTTPPLSTLRRRLTTRTLTLTLTLACALPALAAAPARLVVLVDTATDMPMARFDHFRLVQGIHKDIGEALAGTLGRDVQFLALPRKRIPLALASGDADVLCGYEPSWLAGQYLWSQPLMTQTEVVLTERSSVRPPAVAALAAQPIGTVFGFRYPHLEQALDGAFNRVDAPSIELNLAKLGAGRLQHMVAMQSWFDYRRRQGDIKVSLYPPLVVAEYRTRCALSPRSSVTPRQLDQAIERLLVDGTIAAIAARYR